MDLSAIALQSLCNRFAIALQSLCNHFAITLQSLCNHFAIASHSLCNHFAITLQSLCNRFAIALQSLCNHFAITLQSLCNRFAIASQSLCNHFAITFQSLCNRFACSNFLPILISTLLFPPRCFPSCLRIPSNHVLHLSSHIDFPDHYIHFAFSSHFFSVDFISLSSFPPTIVFISHSFTSHFNLIPHPL
jgi:hypothetical protein